MEEIELSTPEEIRTLGEKENYRHLRILEPDTIKQTEMKEQVRKKTFNSLAKSKYLSFFSIYFNFTL